MTISNISKLSKRKHSNINKFSKRKNSNISKLSKKKNKSKSVYMRGRGYDEKKREKDAQAFWAAEEKRRERFPVKPLNDFRRCNAGNMNNSNRKVYEGDEYKIVSLSSPLTAKQSYSVKTFLNNFLPTASQTVSHNLIKVKSSKLIQNS